MPRKKKVFQLFGEVQAPPRSKFVEIDGVGPVLLQRSSRARRLNISIKPFHGVRVAIPSGVSFQRAIEFTYEKIDWIKKHQKGMRQVEREQMAWRDALEGIDIEEAANVIISRVAELAKMHGFRYNRVTIRNQKTRWGSCSAKNNLNLNIKLFTLPQELVDYVILHELVHTRIKNHSPQFWRELDKYVGDAKALRKLLNEFKI